MATYPPISYDSSLSRMKVTNLTTEYLVRKQLPSEGILISKLSFNCFCFQTLRKYEKNIVIFNLRCVHSRGDQITLPM